MNTPRRMIVLIDGYADPHTAKTAICLIRYRPHEVVAVLDQASAGRTCVEVLGVGGDIPVVARLADAPPATALLLGIAPPGGKIPPHWRTIILEAIQRGLSIVSGLHDFLCDDPEFAREAETKGVSLVDLRKNDEFDVVQRVGLRPGCLRLHTVANDCSCGKMVTAVEVADGLTRRGVDAAFVATGQTGILVAGGGCPIDRVISDFTAGAAEKLVLANQHHEVIVVEGQGSLFHPRYSGVTLSLLHGAIPDGLIMGYEMGRTEINGMPGFALPDLPEAIDFYQRAACLMHPCRVIGVAVNGQMYGDAQVAEECRRVEDQLGLPTCDVIRHGPDKLVDAALALKKQLGK